MMYDISKVQFLRLQMKNDSLHTDGSYHKAYTPEDEDGSQNVVNIPLRRQLDSVHSWWRYW
jgi:hypothetical protein